MMSNKPPFEVGSTVEVYDRGGGAIDAVLVLGCYFMGEGAELLWRVNFESLALWKRKRFTFAGDQQTEWRMVFEGPDGGSYVNHRGPFYALHQRA